MQNRDDFKRHTRYGDGTLLLLGTLLAPAPGYAQSGDAEPKDASPTGALTVEGRAVDASNYRPG
jgi:hypothetical protein